VYRSYQFEYEASLVSHLLAVQEQQRQANTIADLGGFGYGSEGEDDGYGTGKKVKRRKGGRGGYLLDDFALGEDDGLGVGGVGSKRTANKANLDSIYLQKNRTVRRTNYRDQDADYDANAEGRTGYGTRQRTGALGRGARGADRGRRPAASRDQYQYQAQAAQRQRVSTGAPPGMPLWSRQESDLLLAVVHEFGLNWTIVSEVLSQSLGMQGIFRPAAACKQRFRQLTVRT
jgi:Myb-like DNA-binding domain